MNNDFDKKNIVKKKNRQSSTYELELYFKNNIKNNKNSKNNSKKYKNNKNNTAKITKILVNDEIVSETSIKEDNKPLVEEVTLIKKKKLLFFKPSNKKESIKDKPKVINNDEVKINDFNENLNEASINKNGEPQIDDVNLVKKKKFFTFNLFNKKKKDKRNVSRKDKSKNNIIDNNLEQDKPIKKEILEKNDYKEKIGATETLNEISKNNKKKRRKKYLKEALLFIIIILLIDIILYFTTDYISMLRLFDIEYLNIIITIVIALLLLFIGSFLIDYLISELLIEFKNKMMRMKENKKNKKNQITNKKRGGDSYRNQRIKQGKPRKNRKVKE